MAAIFRFQFRRHLAATWAEMNGVVLREGEPGIEIDTHRFKIGDGVSVWADLGYFPQSSEVQSLIQQALDEIDYGGDGSAQAALRDHISSVDPHPAYDDGSSFLLRYMNAKV